jgi:DNA-binding XRE family transcriptional regulator
MKKMNFKEIREKSGMNQAQFGRYFEIPYRTIQDWEHGKRKCPEYLLKLMQYKLENEAPTVEDIKEMTYIGNNTIYVMEYYDEYSGTNYDLVLENEESDKIIAVCKEI